jgi:hypothetical protein
MSDKINPISFMFTPHSNGQGLNTVLKADPTTPGIERRYLQGVSSGIQLDGHEERMTKECIEDFIQQASSKDILLYADKHGFGSSEDIGILEKAEVLSNGDWFTEYRLYDEHDNVGANKLEIIETLWKQVNGLPPYKKAKKKGFSIEGDIPEGGIVSAEKDENGNLIRRVVSKVDLDGVVLVPKPAYKPSMAQAVYKALGELTPQKRNKLQKSIREKLREKVRTEELERNYQTEKWNAIDALDEIVMDIMKKNDGDKREQLQLAFSEYSSIMIDNLMEAESMFLDEDDLGESTEGAYSLKSCENKEQLMQALKSQVEPLKNLIKRKKTCQTKQK